MPLTRSPPEPQLPSRVSDGGCCSIHVSPLPHLHLHELMAWRMVVFSNWHPCKSYRAVGRLVSYGVPADRFLPLQASEERLGTHDRREAAGGTDTSLNLEVCCPNPFA
ncbi:unnamed protein product [Arctogadus glacialis]